MREIYSNEELSRFLDELIVITGVKKVWLSDKIGIPNQNLNRLINKNNLSIDEVNKILKPLGRTAKIIIE